MPLSTVLAASRREMTSGALDTGRYRMRYFTWGEGPPLVFVHGMADVGRSFIPVIHSLRDQFTCVAYELPNGVNDGASLGRYRLADYVTDLLVVLDHLRFDRIALLGSSFGSLVALSALAAAPHRFARAVLQGGFACRPLREWERRLAQVGRFWRSWFGDWPFIHEPVMARVERDVYESVPPEMWRFFVANHGRTPCRAAALRSLTIARTDLRPLLPTIRTPVLLIGGDRDPLVPRSCERDLEDGLPDVRRVEFAPCGHYPQYTHPERMAQEVRGFLR
jgi:pimeloyl-ACP methyl ester carboxylesterase